MEGGPVTPGFAQLVRRWPYPNAARWVLESGYTSIAELARETGIPDNTLRNILRGNTFPKPETVRPLLELSGMSFAEFFHDPAWQYGPRFAETVQKALWQAYGARGETLLPSRGVQGRRRMRGGSLPLSPCGTGTSSGPSRDDDLHQQMRRCHHQLSPPLCSVVTPLLPTIISTSTWCPTLYIISQ